MDQRKRLSFFRKLLSSWISLLILSLIALAFFIIGEVLHNNLLQGLAGVLGGAALSLAITNITSREAVLQQNATETNIRYFRRSKTKKTSLPAMDKWFGRQAIPHDGLA